MGSIQGDLLREAIKKIEGDRNKDYGAPHEDFERTAGMLNSLGYRGPGGREIVASDWAIILIAGKLSRLMHSPDHEDSVQDIGGYAGCYWEARPMAREQYDAEQGRDWVAEERVVERPRTQYEDRFPR